MEAAAFKGFNNVVAVFKERADVAFEDFFSGFYIHTHCTPPSHMHVYSVHVVYAACTSGK
jgi:hypothetical protein